MFCIEIRITCAAVLSPTVEFGMPCVWCSHKLQQVKEGETMKLTLASQKTKSVWQREVYETFIRASMACGGATSTFSITRGLAGSHATAAAPREIERQGKNN